MCSHRLKTESLFSESFQRVTHFASEIFEYKFLEINPKKHRKLARKPLILIDF